MLRNQKTEGFTLLELLVVIAIIGVLSSLLFINLTSVRERGRDLRRKSDLDQVKKALRLYYNDNQKYPAQNPSTANSSGSSISGYAWGTPFASPVSAPTVTWMAMLPKDPSDPTAQYLYYSDAKDKFCLIATLENPSDVDLTVAQTRCSATCGIAPALVQPTTGSKRYAVCND